MDLKLEVVIVPVTDVDKAKHFYGSGLACRLDTGGGLAGGFQAGTEGRVTGPDPQGRSYASYAPSSDPDGNGWLLQEITERLPGRV
jgi:catechol 2,3-dioxygenase-like lactoylglutathione lyase family enzyme